MPDSGSRTITDPKSLPFTDRHVGAHYAAVHRTDALQIGIYALDPGGCIPPHRHSVSWDIALVLEGEIEACIGEGPAARVVRCGVHAMNLVPPGIVHTLRNPSADAQARFLLVQSPSRDFDFLRVA